MNTIFDRLNEEEKNKIEKYISNFSYSNDIEGNVNKERASLEYVLRFWNKEKNEYLYKMLGNELIISKQISIKKSIEEIICEFRHEAYDSPINVFINEFYDLLCPAKPELMDVRYTLMNLVDMRNLATNIWNNGTIIVKFPNEDKPYKINNGIKVMKVLAKFAEVYNLKHFENFRLRHSQILNQKDTHGLLCLSIHPLDYMTMSDNDSDWSSCMSWKDDGEYRQGTVEMMNSDCIVMAYLKGEHNMTIEPNLFWNNKKWRELFIVNKNIITSIKGYPYQSNELTDITLEWIKELCKKNLDWSYNNKIREHVGDHEKIYDDENKNWISYNFYTSCMYNDFNCMPEGYCHRAYIANFDNKSHKLFYSGVSECVWCGAKFNDNEDTNRVICNNCVTCYTCDRCSAHVDCEDDLYEVDGCYYCADCMDYYTETDPITNEIHKKDLMTKIYLMDNEDNKLDIACYVYDLDLFKNKADKYFIDGIEAINEYTTNHGFYNHNYYGININQLKNDEAANLFKDLDYFEPIDMNYLKENFPSQFK